METVNNMTDNIVFLMTTYGLRVLGVLIVFFLAWFVAGMVRNWIIKALGRSNFDATLSKFFANTARYTILLFVGLGCLGVFGIETASFAALLAGAGLAIGLAFQGTLSNISAGIMLLIFRPFKVGNYITVSGCSGTVDEIELFTTTLKTPDNRKLIIPNGSVFGATIENVTAHPTRRCDVSVGVSYDADVDATRKVLEAAVQTIPDILSDPAPQIFLASLGASSVDWQVRVWCKTENYWNVYQAGIRQVKYALDKANIGIPYPQVDVHFDSPVVDSLRVGRGKAAHA